MNQLLNMLRRRLMTTVLWQALAVGAFVAIPITNHITQQTAMSQMRFAAMDSKNFYYLTKMGSFQTEQHIRAETAKLAAETIFNRGPKDLDNEERIDRLFDSKIAGYLRTRTGQDSEAFLLGQRHQKIETGEIREISVDENTSKVSVEGQLLSQYVFNQHVMNDIRKVKLWLQLKVNDHMDSNGMFPVIVENYEQK